MFERETFPRFHIGESLLSTANDSFALLGIAERMASAGFPVKWGARLLTHDGASGRGIDFRAVTEVTRPQTYQVPRAEFDQMLMNRARELGVEPPASWQPVLDSLIRTWDNPIPKVRQPRRTKTMAHDLAPPGTDSGVAVAASGRLFE